MTDPMIEAEGLRKQFGSTQALDGLDLQVQAGQILGVLGPNGAGKTTAVRVLTTLSRPIITRFWRPLRASSTVAPWAVTPIERLTASASVTTSWPAIRAYP